MTAAPAERTRRRGNRVVRLARHALELEFAIWASLGRLVARRPRVPAGAERFGYHRPVLTIVIVFIVLSAAEIPILDLIVHRWEAVRIGVLVLGIWGLTWMVGLLAAYLVRPHSVGPTGILVQNGLDPEIALPWNDIASVEHDRRIDEPKSPKIVEDAGRRTLVLRMQEESNIVVELERPTAVRRPGGEREVVDAVRFHVDDAAGFMAAVRRHIP